MLGIPDSAWRIERSINTTVHLKDHYLIQHEWLINTSDYTSKNVFYIISYVCQVHWYCINSGNLLLTELLAQILKYGLIQLLYN